MDEFEISDTTSNKNNSEIIANAELFFVLIDEDFFKSQKAMDEFRQAKALGKPIHAIILANYMKNIPEEFKTTKFESFAIVSSDRVVPYTVKMILRKHMKEKGAGLQN